MERENFKGNRRNKVILRNAICLGNGEEPIATFIIASGWKDKFHVVTEFGDLSDNDSTHEIMTKDEVLEKYGLDSLDICKTSIKKLEESYPNDYDFGRSVRNFLKEVDL